MRYIAKIHPLHDLGTREPVLTAGRHTKNVQNAGSKIRKLMKAQTGFKERKKPQNRNDFKAFFLVRSTRLEFAIYSFLLQIPFHLVLDSFINTVFPIVLFY